MPLYEFYCGPCHTIFTFRSHRVDTTTVPPCPVCGKPLKREVSLVNSCIAGKVAEPGSYDNDELANAKTEELIAQMSNRMMEMEGDDAEPADAVRMMRELARTSGLKFNKDVEEAFARIESGEDPEKIDQEFQEVFDETHNPFDGSDEESGAISFSDFWKRMHPPRHDPDWHDMPEGEK
ncbi:MAG: zinc ribbon domain-containing protein [Kiritimatiellae bacterium]|nr:zinc ribbon domain-containing protein [Kiritimatiellia bacterium]